MRRTIRSAGARGGRSGALGLGGWLLPPGNAAGMSGAAPNTSTAPSALVDLIFALLVVGTLLLLVAGGTLLLRAAFTIATARGDQEQRRAGLAEARRVLVGIAIVGLAHLLLTLSLRYGWGPL